MTPATGRPTSHEPKPCKMFRLQAILRALEKYCVELGLIPCSLWAAKCMWTLPSNFEAFPGGWHLAKELLPAEWMWGALAASSALAKLIGFSLIYWPRFAVSSIVFRCLGLGMSGTFWFLVGLSTLLGNNDSLYGPMAMLFAISAWWMLVRFPAIPGHGE